MKKNRVMICLVAGVCVLAVSASAAFGGVSGYANYKNAVKALAIEVDNVTLAASGSATLDGETLFDVSVDYAMDGANFASHEHSQWSGQETAQEQYTTLLNGTETWYNSRNNDYYQVENVYREANGHGLLNVAADDEFSNRLINFFELGADTIMGSLKNNFVEISSSGGVHTYQVDISGSQVPSLVNAGLSLWAYGLSQGEPGSYVSYENYPQTVIAYYEKTSGETLSNEFVQTWLSEKYPGDEWYNQNEALLDKVYEASNQMDEEYRDQLEKKASGEGVLFVHADGSTDFYPTTAAYLKATGGTSDHDLRRAIGEDLTLKNIHMTFSLDKSGRLVDNDLTAEFTTTDSQGGQHTLAVNGKAVFTDYGSTKIQPLDVSGRTLGNAGMNAVPEDVEITEETADDEDLSLTPGEDAVPNEDDSVTVEMAG